MKHLKLGIILVLIIGLSACSKQIPELTDEFIRSQLNSYLEIYDYTSIENFTYEISKTSETKINAVGEVDMTNQLGKLTGDITLGFIYNENKWVLVNKYFTVTNATLNQDSRIRNDAFSQVLNYTDAQFKDISYTLSKYEINKWEVTGEIIVETSLGTQIGTFTLGYKHVGTTWELYNNSYKMTVIVDSSPEPTAEKAFSRFQESFFSSNDLFIEYHQMTSIEKTIDLANGTGTFIFKYTLTNELKTTNFTVTITALHQEEGWVYTLASRPYEEVLDYEGTYTLNWDILETETFYKDKEAMIIKLTGQIKISGSRYYYDSVVDQNNVEATVIFRGVETKVAPTLINDGSNSCITMKYGTNEKETVTLCYNEEDYKGGQMMAPIFYGVSFDQSHAVTGRTR